MSIAIPQSPTLSRTNAISAPMMGTDHWCPGFSRLELVRAYFDSGRAQESSSVRRRCLLSEFQDTAARKERSHACSCRRDVLPELHGFTADQYVVAEIHRGARRR